ncbi:AcvB/VirJ family lysyl-phosphatidylglycerol hydrolase [Mangrovitalea sediminis]|uniref:AcvB/VirJ family lysyl-phosphatidylglycerol hydrolase n=1 Tax=Mangrovitalea sediminis TaxID=1982043 RepID=UPI000BE55BF1|nr:AcvB/VirJ family lysyl-phosphatidylglycerol hydrolase [Mangrovitalea sediminis]
MRRLSTLLLLLLLPITLMIVNPERAEARDDSTTLTFGALGTLHIYRPAGDPQQVVLFASGDGGWNLGVLDMARALRDQGAMVIGFSTPHYLGSLNKRHVSCHYPAGDLEAVAQFVEKSFRLPHYHAPLLVGYSSGATLVYGALAEAPPGTFIGGISLGFSDDLAVRRPLCRGAGLHNVRSKDGKEYLLRPGALAVPWIALQGDIDLDVSPKAANDFVAQVKNGEIVNLPHVGHGFSVNRHWMPQYLAAYRKIVEQQAAGTKQVLPVALGDLPVIEVPATHPKGDTFAVILSGDGGWVSIDKDIGRQLAASGLPVVGFNSLQYFWSPRKPAGMADDLDKIIRHYLNAWHRSRVMLIGYSRGADVLPFMVSRLSPALRKRVTLVGLLGPSLKTSFEFHVSDWLMDAAHGTDQPIGPEVHKLDDLSILCVYGADETDTLCPRLQDMKNVRMVKTEGGHHFDGDYRHLASLILHQAEVADNP